MKNGQCALPRSYKGWFRDLFDTSVLSITDNGKKITLLSILIPKLFENLYTKLISSLDTKLISSYAEDAVGAITSANQVISIFSTLLAITTLGATILISIELGGGNREKAASIVSTALIMLSISSIICSAFIFLSARRFLLILNLTGDSLKYGTEYLKIAGGLLIINTITGFLNTMLICNGKAFHSMMSSVISNTFNLLFIFL